MHEYLKASDVIDYNDPEVAALATRLASGTPSVTAATQRCFEWVRDEIAHSLDVGATRVTCSASEVLREGFGFCYAKSHLLAALLRANGIPAGMCYQRLSADGQGAPYCLHGLNGVYLEDYGWYRVDPRGNRNGIDAQFCPPVEKLAYPIALEGEADLPDILPAPLPVVVEALRSFKTTADLCANLPDAP
jgi:transglutaminase-like putative cysteine protease